jgi:hypothetical protein
MPASRIDRDLGASNPGAAVRGRLVDEATGLPAAAFLRISSATMTAGRGEIEFVVDGPDFRLIGDRMAWIVTTRHGWTHLRGHGRIGDDEAPAAFRLDIRPHGDGSSASRLALRIYTPDAQSGDGAPIHRLTGVLDPGPSAREIGRQGAE